jgi:DNA-binding SARP family transcriptional activator
VPHVGVDVAVLGPVTVTVNGAAVSFRRSASLDLVVYLAFHRNGVRHADWSLAIWPDRAVAAATVHSTCSDARRALGLAPDGTAHLPRGVNLRLCDSACTDVEQFATRAASDDPRRLREALRLVRGPLLAGLRHGDWAVFDGTRSRIESLVVSTALRGAEASIRRGDGGEAAWMVRQALRVSPYDERLYRALLQATAAQGNRVALRSTMAELLTLAGEVVRPPAVPYERPRGEVSPLSCLHPETAALYRGLLLERPAAGAHPGRL